MSRVPLPLTDADAPRAVALLRDAAELGVTAQNLIDMARVTSEHFAAAAKEARDTVAAIDDGTVSLGQHPLVTYNGYQQAAARFAEHAELYGDICELFAQARVAAEDSGADW